MHITPGSSLTTVPIEYTKTVDQDILGYPAAEHIDNYGHSLLVPPAQKRAVPCFEFSMSYDNNTMWIPIHSITELRFSPPTRSQMYWRIGFCLGGGGDIERENEYVTSADSAMRLFAAWHSQH